MSRAGSSDGSLLPTVLASALFMDLLDTAALGTALPTMARDFGTDPLHLRPALTAYLVTVAILVPASGWIADRFGARRVFSAAMALFLAGSVCCGLSSGVGELVAARVVQGIGGAMMTPVARTLGPTAPLAEALAAIYEREPRISVDRSPSPFHYWRHGKNLIGVCHGHEARKLDKLPLLMATDRPRDWGETVHRYWYTGHVHSDRVLDVEGTRVESFRVLPPTDAWAHGKGYRSGREMKALVLHAEYGETMRVSFKPEMMG